MISSAREAQLCASLAKAINDWMFGDDSDDRLEGIGYVGEHLEVYMARAAMTVLLGLTDAQECAIAQDCLRDVGMERKEQKKM